MAYQEIFAQVQPFVQALFENSHHKKLFYHDLKHTENVVEKATQIAGHYRLNDRDMFLISTASWFHDTGYIADHSAGHEERSVKIASDFLIKHHADEKDIEAIKQIILATEMPQKPVGLLQEIICDADLFHLGTDKFLKISKEVKKDIEELTHHKISGHAWREKNIEFLEQHHYFTDYCRLLLDEGQKKNLEKLKSKQEKTADKRHATEGEIEEVHQLIHAYKEGNITMEEVKEETHKDGHKGDHHHKDEDQKAGAKSKKDEKPERGIETMFRISSGNHQRLSDMADNKAHIMITVNSIILSAIISLVLKSLSSHPQMVVPSILLITVSLLTLTFAILATRPTIPNGLFTPQDVEQKKVNLLFFGNFYKMDFQSYSDGMFAMMEDKDFLYGSLIKDLYSQGVVLGKKYRLLRISYNIFMFGIIASVLGYFVAILITGRY